MSEDVIAVMYEDGDDGGRFVTPAGHRPAVINWMCPGCGAPNAAQAGADMPEKCRACGCGLRAPGLLGGTE